MKVKMTRQMSRSSRMMTALGYWTLVVLALALGLGLREVEAKWDGSRNDTLIGKSLDECRKRLGEEQKEPVGVGDIGGGAEKIVQFQDGDWWVAVGLIQQKVVVVVYVKRDLGKDTDRFLVSSQELTEIRKWNGNGQAWIPVVNAEIPMRVWTRTDKKVAVFHDASNNRVLVIQAEWLGL